MLSHNNGVDTCVASAVGFVWDAKTVFPTLVCGVCWSGFVVYVVFWTWFVAYLGLDFVFDALVVWGLIFWICSCLNFFFYVDLMLIFWVLNFLGFNKKMMLIFVVWTLWLVAEIQIGFTYEMNYWTILLHLTNGSYGLSASIIFVVRLWLLDGLEKIWN